MGARRWKMARFMDKKGDAGAIFIRYSKYRVYILPYRILPVRRYGTAMQQQQRRAGC